MPELSAKVATVLDEEQIVLNVGAVDGVSVGDRVDLWNVVSVTDPDTGGKLGVVRTQKIRLEAREVQEHLTVARVYAPAFNFGSLIFQGSPTKTINTPGRDNNSVSVTRGEEATVYVQSVELESSPSDEEE